MTSKEAKDYLISLIERDTPKKVIYENPDRPKCPNCNSYDCTIYMGYRDDEELNFCNNCGQRLDWSE